MRKCLLQESGLKEVEQEDVRTQEDAEKVCVDVVKWRNAMQ